MTVHHDQGEEDNDRAYVGKDDGDKWLTDGRQWWYCIISKMVIMIITIMKMMVSDDGEAGGNDADDGY